MSAIFDPPLPLVTLHPMLLLNVPAFVGTPSCIKSSLLQIKASGTNLTPARSLGGGCLAQALLELVAVLELVALDAQVRILGMCHHTWLHPTRHRSPPNSVFQRALARGTFRHKVLHTYFSSLLPHTSLSVLCKPYTSLHT